MLGNKSTLEFLTCTNFQSSKKTRAAHYDNAFRNITAEPKTGYNANDITFISRLIVQVYS